MLVQKFIILSKNKIIAMKTLQFAHRGARLSKNKTILHVENSLPAILAGLKHADGVEIDVLYVNQTWWISHDFKLNRFESKQTLNTATKNTVLKQGNITSQLLTIEDLILALNNHNLTKKKHINIEIKTHLKSPSLKQAFELVALVNKLNTNKHINIFFSSFNQKIINGLKKKNILVGYLIKSYKDAIKLKNIEKNVFVITMEHNFETEKTIKYVAKKFGNLCGIYFLSEDDYFNYHKDYQNKVKVMFSETICE